MEPLLLNPILTLEEKKRSTTSVTTTIIQNNNILETGEKQKTRSSFRNLYIDDC